jgi:hypothetical protein
MQQVGGALGLACLVTLALRHAAGQVTHGVPAAVAAAHGYALSFRIGAVLLVIGRIQGAGAARARQHGAL